ncbi:MAG: HAMP domain-containing sensor histidine kinase [Gemmatimonadaceae bacterium]
MTILVLLLAAIVAVAALLAFEAHNASRAERRTVERALNDYVATAAWEYQSALRKSLDAEVLRAFGVVTAGVAQTPRDPLVPLAMLRESALESLPCADGTRDSSRILARFDLGSGAVVLDPPAMSPVDRAVLESSLLTVSRSLPTPGRPYAVMWGTKNAQRATVVAVRYARLEVPVALYAFSVCASALRLRIPDDVARTHRLLPDAVANGASNDSLLALTIRDADGASILREGGKGSGLAHITTPLPDLGDATLEISLLPAAERRLLLVPSERASVPLLIGLLSLTTLLATVALVQIRRENEIARLRADFTSSVSHELRTPLAQILLFGETLSLERVRSPEERRLAADTIVREARRLMQLVDNILHFAQLRRGAPQLQLADMSAAVVVADVVAAFVPLAEARGTRVVLERRDERFVRADREALRQVILNLLDNATKYGKRGQTVRVLVDGAATGVRIVVDDEGDGIALSDRERVWLPYVRLGGRGNASGGSGLGLAVVRELAEAMGASVHLTESAGGGASFTITFPEVISAQPARPEVHAPAAVGAHARVVQSGE